jgi:phosphatidylglycerol:prolipoprotein diacylglycerol transferase
MMIALGAFAAIYIAMRRSRDANIHPDTVLDLGLFSVVWGVIGARVFFVVENWQTFFASAERAWYHIFFIWEGGLVFYGGAVGGALYFIYALWRHRMGMQQALTLLDIAASLMPLGLAFGRMGCWFNGCCWGGQCEVDWGVRFPGAALMPPEGSGPWGHQVRHGLIEQSDAYSLWIHPSQMYAVANALILFLILGFIYRRRLWAGMVGGAWLILYAGQRFLEEMARGDPVAVQAGLRTSQMIAIAMVLIGIPWLIVTWRIHRKHQERDEPTPAGAA